MQDDPLIRACRALSVAQDVPRRGSTWHSSLRATNGTAKRQTMPRYIIEREIPGAAKLSAAELKAIAQKSCAVLDKLGPKIQWIESYVTGDKVYCVYISPNEQLVREHAQQGGFPANRISEIKTVIDPTTAE